MNESDDYFDGSSLEGLSSDDLLREAREHIAGHGGDAGSTAGSVVPSDDLLREARERIAGNGGVAGDVGSAAGSVVPSNDLSREARERFGVPRDAAGDVVPNPRSAAAPTMPSLPLPDAPPQRSAMPAPENLFAPQPRSGDRPIPPSLDVGLNQPNTVPHSNPTPVTSTKRRFPVRPLAIGISVVVALAVFSFAGRGTTSSTNLTVGDCFEIPSGTEITSVTDQPCSTGHEAQIYAEVATIAGSSADDQCIAELIPLLETYELPEDFSFASIEQSPTKWLCLLTSESAGLVGSIVPGG